jgi:APA family basic amino acid/polyamine antiporter
LINDLLTPLNILSLSVTRASMNVPQRQFSLFDTTSIIVGIVIGAGIFETSPLIANNVNGVPMLMGVWIAGGVLALCGAVCFAELTTRRPQAGGDYIYLTEAYGSQVGLLYAWSEFWIIRPGSIGAMAYVFAFYANNLVPLNDLSWKYVLYGLAATIVLTIINVVGVTSGKRTQNLLTVVKVVGLLAVVIVGLTYSSPASPTTQVVASDGGFNLSLAMILVMFTYGGWNDMAFVAAEVRDPKKNLLRALCLGTLTVTAIYVLVSAAFVSALGMEGFRGSQAVAADVVSLRFSAWGGKIVSLLVCVSCLGAINGMLLTGARVYYALGKEHRMFAWLGHWHPRWGTPARSLIAQALVAVALIISFGPERDGFTKMVIFTTPVFWFFFLLTGISLFVFRWRDAKAGQPDDHISRAVLYPLTPIVFCLTSIYMMYASVTWAWSNRSYEAFWSIGIFAVGLVVAWFSSRATNEDTTTP